MYSPSSLIWSSGKYLVVFCVLLLIVIYLSDIFVKHDGDSRRSTTSLPIRDTGNSRSLEIVNYLMTSSMLLIAAITVCSRSFLITKVVTFFPKFTGLFCLGLMYVSSEVLKKAPNTPEFKYGRKFAWIMQSIVMAPCFTFFDNEVSIKAGATAVMGVVLAKMLATSWIVDIHERGPLRMLWSYLALSLVCIISPTLQLPLNVWSTCVVTANVFGGILFFFAAFISNFQYSMTEMTYGDNLDVLYTASTLFVSCLNLYLRLALYNVVEDSQLLNYSECL